MVCRTCTYYKSVVDPLQLSLTYEKYEKIVDQMRIFRFSNLSYQRDSLEYFETILKLLKL